MQILITRIVCALRLQRMGRSVFAFRICALFAMTLTAGAQTGADPLPSWNDGATKQAIVDFVTRVTKDGGPDFVPPGDRIATFDNDGTLWTEQPIYTEFAFVFDRVQEMAPQHPEWQTQQPYAALFPDSAPELAFTSLEIRLLDQLIQNKHRCFHTRSITLHLHQSEPKKRSSR